MAEIKQILRDNNLAGLVALYDPEHEFGEMLAHLKTTKTICQVQRGIEPGWGRLIFSTKNLLVHKRQPYVENTVKMFVFFKNQLVRWAGGVIGVGLQQLHANFDIDEGEDFFTPEGSQDN